MKRKAALYDPFLDTLGGGEKHILSILKALEKKGFEITVFWDNNISKSIQRALHLNFSSPLIFAPSLKKRTFFEKRKALKSYDYFFYVTDGSYFFSPAKKNYVFCMVPKQDLYRMDIANRIKTRNFSFISNSRYTKKWLEKWGVQSEVLYPHIDNDFIDINIQSLKKDNIILSVGRFFPHLHSKRQDIAIKMFNKLQHQNNLFKDFTLILAGGLQESDKEYFSYLQSLVGNNTSIILKQNISYNELKTLYKKSLYYWHFAGYGIDENKNPELVEHLGISPLEAMAAGCVPFCFKNGGPKEIISNGINGFLFESEQDLFEKMNEIASVASLHKKIQNAAKQYVGEHFRYDVFEKNAYKVLNI